MPTIVVLGATGRLGGAAAKAFVAEGWTVKGVVRDQSTSKLAPGIEPVVADAFDRDALVAGCAGADIVLHALNPAYDKWAGTVLPWAENALAAAEATGATLMVPGNVYVYGTSIGMDADEETPAQPDIEKGRIRAEMEALFERAATERGARTIIIRAGDFFGGTAPGSWFDLTILKDLPKNRFVWPGPWDCVHALAYMPDLAEAFVRVAARRAELDPFTTLHFGGYAVTCDDVHEAAEEAVGRPLKKGSVPWPMLRAVGLFNPMLRAVAEMSYLWRVPHSLDNTRLQALIGEEPHTPLPDALRQAIADLSLDTPR